MRKPTDGAVCEQCCDWSGLVSRCPGYVAVKIDDWTTSEQLFHHDLVVTCGFNPAPVVTLVVTRGSIPVPGTT